MSPDADQEGELAGGQQQGNYSLKICCAFGDIFSGRGLIDVATEGGEGVSEGLQGERKNCTLRVGGQHGMSAKSWKTLLENAANGTNRQSGMHCECKDTPDSLTGANVPSC